MKKFEVGDRIEVIEDDLYHGADVGDMGVVVGIIYGTEPTYAVRFDKPRDYFHDCGDLCEDHYGQYMFEKQMRLVYSEIYNSGGVK